jgi:hypothetical protein
VLVGTDKPVTVVGVVADEATAQQGSARQSVLYLSYQQPGRS